MRSASLAATEGGLRFAHRGGMADAPENSLEAFTGALARGVRGLESDVWFDAAGQPVLHHGPARRLRTPPVSLAELFAVCGTDFDLSLDLKQRGTARRTVEVAAAAGFDLSRLWLCGRGGEPLRWRSVHRDVRLVTDTRLAHALPSPGAYLRRLAAGGVDAVNLRRGRWTPGLVRRVHAQGLLAFAWDVQSKARLDAVLRLGVDAVYSDSVDLLLQG